MKQPLIIITGPTAVGKTSLSIQLAHAIGGEIISADSMQVYRGMDVGTAKILPEEMGGIPHHLINIMDPSESFNIVEFQKHAKHALQEIYANKHIPIVAGGTGFYIQSLIKDLSFNETSQKAINSYRKELEQLTATHGNHYVHNMLREIDPVSADCIHENNCKRVIRAIEYFKETGEPISKLNEQQRMKDSPYNYLYYVLTMNRDQLYERINQRIDIMLANGLIEEVQKLKEQGYNKTYVSMQGLGYKEILDYLNGLTTLEEAVDILKRDTRHFAKRQLTWFRREENVIMLQKENFADDAAILEKILADIKTARME